MIQSEYKKNYQKIVNYKTLLNSKILKCVYLRLINDPKRKCVDHVDTVKPGCSGVGILL